MIQPYLFLCSGAKISNPNSLQTKRKILSLSYFDCEESEKNVNISLENVTEVLLATVPPRLKDLLEIASYIYAGDCAATRGNDWENNDTVEPWERDLSFVIPVRDLEFWEDSKVQDLLRKSLTFLSNDKWTFNFRKFDLDRYELRHFELGKLQDWPFYNIDRVIMFSGGLDSLAGAVESATNGENLILASHRSTGIVANRQKELFNRIEKKYPGQIMHIPVWINKGKKLSAEYTQRTRSFLYFSIGVVIADSVKAKGLRFFENGIVSLNLPVADEVLQARASRTTHPISLYYFTELSKLILDNDFIVDNPYIYKTKSDVVDVIFKSNAKDLIAYTCSCAHTIFKPKTQWHCGTCSQCIDRRIAILANDLQEDDPETDYMSDVFTGRRKDGYEKNMAVNYVRHAIELHTMSDIEIAGKFNTELSRAIRFESNKQQAMKLLIDMHKRHADSVKKVLDRELKEISMKIIDGTLEKTSMIALIAGGEHHEKSWVRFAERIYNILLVGIATACKSRKPKNEPELQKICDSILKNNDNDLIREFPFMSWSSSLTRSDWSNENFKFVVELKYVKKIKDIQIITQGITKDITEYGDNKRRVLFLVYDPNHLIVDEENFSKEITKKETMLIRIIR